MDDDTLHEIQDRVAALPDDHRCGPVRMACGHAEWWSVDAFGVEVPCLLCHRTNPKPRAALSDEPIDPNVPVIF